jgi:hypothetical protein
VQKCRSRIDRRKISSRYGHRVLAAHWMQSRE